MDQSFSSQAGGHQPSGEAAPEEDRAVRMHRLAAAFDVDIARPDIPAGEVWYTASLEGRLIARSRDLCVLLDQVERKLGSSHEDEP